MRFNPCDMLGENGTLTETPCILSQPFVLWEQNIIRFNLQLYLVECECCGLGVIKLEVRSTLLHCHFVNVNDFIQLICRVESAYWTKLN